jgi:fibro-slime domain-containing protein
MKFISVVAAVIVSLVSFVWPQTIFPPTIKVPVTFYDFYADGCNPEFEINPGWSAGLNTGMVAAMLDSQSKPVLGPTPYYNCQIAKWFRPFTSGDFTIPNYTNPATTTCSNQLGTVNYDTAFKNIVIQDTLTFTLVPGSLGIYEYTNSNFFPLDGKGFGNEPTGYSHNYGFTMEMHWEFMYQKGLTFQFEGEDDLWVFINGRLAIDLGGIHNAMPSSINLDTIPGLTTGKPYMLDVFYAQRHVPGSDIRITTDIIAVCPCEWELLMEMVPNKDTIPLGDSVVLHAFVMDDTGGIRPDVSALCDWSLSPSGTACLLRTTRGDNNTFYANSANQLYSITTSYNGPPLQIDYPFLSTCSRKIYVKPAPASNRIERTSISRAIGKSQVHEFYNLHGQKLQETGTARIDGIVVERIINPDGTMSVKGTLQVPDFKVQFPRLVNRK